MQRVAQVGVQQGRAGVAGHRLTDQIHRFRGPSPLEGDHTQQVQCVGLARRGGQNLPVKAFGLRGASGPMVLGRDGQRLFDDVHEGAFLMLGPWRHIYVVLGEVR